MRQSVTVLVKPGDLIRMLPGNSVTVCGGEPIKKRVSEYTEKWEDIR